MTSNLRSAAPTVIVILVLIGIVTSWVNAVVLTEAIRVEESEYGELEAEMTKTPAYYATHALAMFSFTAAGIVAALSGRFGVFGFPAKAAFYVLAATAAVWAVASYSRGEILSTQIVGATGPFVWWSLILVAAGADRRVWPPFEKLIEFLSYATAGIAVLTLAGTRNYSSHVGPSKFTQYAILLTWLGGWTLLSGAGAHGWRLAMRAVPFLALVLMALCAQSRSWLILAGLLAAGFVALRAREMQSRRAAFHALAAGAALLIVCAGLVYAGWGGAVTAAATGLNDRLTEDTRSNQYVGFFADVQVTELILGRGPKGTWFWPDVGPYQFFDNGYLWTLFIGGVPMLVSYAAFVVAPGIRAARRRPEGKDAVAAGMVLLWGIALTGLSTFVLPSLTLPSYLISLYAGRCQLAVAESETAAIT